jgi:hypothetical protein
MSHSIRNRNRGNFDDDQRIDRLVDGELPEAERRELLLRFENQPNGWRRCALAFLEAQVWRQALSLEAAPRAASMTAMPIGPCSAKSKFWRSMARTTVIAASLLTAFALGRSYHKGPDETSHVTAGAQHDSAATRNTLVADAAGSIRQPVMSDNPKAQSTTSLSPTQATHVSLDSMLKRWQQEGYRVETQPCVVSVQAKDGRKINFPVQEVRVRYVGDRVY